MTSDHLQQSQDEGEESPPASLRIDRRAAPKMKTEIFGQRITRIGGLFHQKCSNKRDPTAIQGAINSLGAEYREVLILRDVQHLSIKQTTAILGISGANAKTRLHRARFQMRDRLAPGLDGCWIKGQSYRKIRPF